MHNYANEIMQRVFAAIYAIYKKVVLKHSYNKYDKYLISISFYDGVHLFTQIKVAGNQMVFV